MKKDRSRLSQSVQLVTMANSTRVTALRERTNVKVWGRAHRWADALRYHDLECKRRLDARQVSIFEYIAKQGEKQNASKMVAADVRGDGGVRRCVLSADDGERRRGGA